MAAAWDDVELRLRDELMDLFSLLERNGMVFPAPDDEYRHLQLRQDRVCRILAGKHGRERAVDDPGILL